MIHGVGRDSWRWTNPPLGERGPVRNLPMKYTTEDMIRLQLAAAATEQPLAEKRGRMLEKDNANEAINPTKRGRPKHIPVII